MCEVSVFVSSVIFRKMSLQPSSGSIREVISSIFVLSELFVCALLSLFLQPNKNEKSPIRIIAVNCFVILLSCYVVVLELLVTFWGLASVAEIEAKSFNLATQ